MAVPHSNTVSPTTTHICAYGTFALPLAAAFIALQILIPNHYAQVTSLSLSSIGWIILAARLWDTFTDPLIGLLSDKTPATWGRRKLWIALSVPLICLSTYKLFNPAPEAGSGYLLFWSFMIYVSGTMAIVPHGAWGAEMTRDFQQRSRITGSRTFFGLIGTLAALSIAAVLGSGNTNELQETLTAITYLVMISLGLSLLALLIVPDNSTIKLPANALTSALKLLNQPSPFRTLLGSFLLNSMANAIPATLFLFYISEVLDAPELAGPLLFLYFICATISVPFWVGLSKRLGKHRSWHYSIIVACLFFAITPFLGPDSLWLYWVIVVVTGFTTGCDLILPSSMNGDLIEWDAATTGHKRPGLFFALWGTTTKLAYALAIGIAFPVLDALGFSAGGNNTSDAISALAWLYGLPCILLKMGALLTMRHYPIDEQEYQQLIEKQQ